MTSNQSDATDGPRVASGVVEARAKGASLVAVGLAPFAAGAGLAAAGIEVDGAAVVCPFRAATGLPCPLCGSTRAFVLLGDGDGAWLAQNVVVVAAFAGLATVGVLLLLREQAGSRVAHALGRPSAWIALAVVAWGWTLAHAGTIAPA